MLNLEKTRNRMMFMIITILASFAVVALSVPGINAVGIMFAVAVFNILVYYALPDTYSSAYMDRYSGRYSR